MPYLDSMEIFEHNLCVQILRHFIKQIDQNYTNLTLKQINNRLLTNTLYNNIDYGPCVNNNIEEFITEIKKSIEDTNRNILIPVDNNYTVNHLMYYEHVMFFKYAMSFRENNLFRFKSYIRTKKDLYETFLPMYKNRNGKSHRYLDFWERIKERSNEFELVYIFENLLVQNMLDLKNKLTYIEDNNIQTAKVVHIDDDEDFYIQPAEIA
jgi:hypothetical protein